MSVAVPLDQSTFAISQAMQGAASVAYAIAFVALHRSLRRETTFAWAGLWILLAALNCLAAAAGILFESQPDATLITAVALAAVGLWTSTGPWIIGATRLSVGLRAPRQPIVRWSFGVAAGMVVTDLLLLRLFGGTTQANVRTLFLAARLAAVGFYGVAAWIIWRAAARPDGAPRALRWALTLFVARLVAVIPLGATLFNTGTVGYQPRIWWVVIEMASVAFLGVATVMVVIRDEHALSLAAEKRMFETQEDFKERARTTERLESLGRLAGTVAHDFNNLLTVIGGMAEAAREELTGKPGPHVELAEIEKAARRGADLTRQLLAFARRQPSEPHVDNVCDRLADLRPMLAHAAGTSIALRLHPAVERCAVRIDRSQFDQALLNLVVNARDALPDGGHIDITNEHLVLSAALAAEADLTAGIEMVCVSVRDDGVGMPREVLTRVFEPFFTTKARGKGTGLGLASVYGFARQHGGTVTVESEPGLGTTFRILLPSHAEPA